MDRHDGIHFPLGDGDHVRLLNALVDTYDVPRRIRPLVRLAEISVGKIEFDGAAYDVWLDVLTIAGKRGQLGVLLRVILADDDSVLIRPLIEAFLSAAVPEVAPGIPRLASPGADSLQAEGTLTLPDGGPGGGPGGESQVGTARMQLVRTLTGHSAWLNGLSFSPDGAWLASADMNGGLLLSAVDTGAQLESPIRQTGMVCSVAFSPDGTLLASAGADHVVRLWDMSARTGARELTGHTDEVYGVAFSPDGMLLASAGADRTVRLWSVSSGKPLRVHAKAHSDVVCSVAFSPDGMLLASAGADRTVRVWSVPGGEARHTFNGHPGKVSRAAFSPVLPLLASADWVEDTIRMWNTASGESAGFLSGPDAWVLDIAFRPDGVLATASARDGRIRLWTITDRVMVAEWTAHRGPASCLAFSRDGRLLASGGGQDHEIHIWSAAPVQAIQKAI